MRPYLRVANVLDGRIDWTDILEINVPPADAERCALRDGDILLNKGNSMNLVGRPAIFRPTLKAECYFQDHLLRFRAREGVAVEFAQAYFQHLLYTLQFTRIAVASTSIATIPSDSFEALPFPLPPAEEQAEMVAEMRALIASQARLVERASNASSLARTLIASCFGARAR
jgi:restriction endonuclease S subunit